jgi:outer membrane protein OmpA-like peptidoglycan-associated protein
MNAREGSVRFLFCLLLLLAAAPVAAMTLELNAIDFPERQTVDVSFTPQAGAPPAKMAAKVTYRDGQSSIELSYDGMKPAILFGGDVTSYTLWVVTRDGQAVNLGELLAAKPKGSQSYSTSHKSFALMVTTEPYYLVSVPSALPAFTSDALETKKLASSAFSFSGFREMTPERAMDSITDIAWDSKTPLELLQARKAFEIAGKVDAKEFAGQFYKEAGEALELANAQFEKSPGSKKLIDYSRRSVALSNEAINISIHRIEGLRLEEEIAARRAEMAELEAQTAELEVQTAELEAQTAEARVKVAVMEGETARLSEQSAVLSTELESVLDQVADTESTARGYVVSLPDILFDFNKATLKPEAEVVLAKLSGILLVIQKLDIEIEGYTDSTGSPDYNLELSTKRSQSVLELMAREGISSDRMVAVGMGMDRPVADNSTEEGRSKNRRVEIILSER